MKVGNIVYRTGLFGMTPAMEAPEDLTATTNDAMKRAGGRNRQRSDFEPPQTSEQTQQENASGAGGDGSISADIDAITPDNAPGGGDQGGGGEPSDMGNPDAGGGDDFGMGDDGGMDDGMGGDDGMGDDMGGGDMGGGDYSDGEDPEEAAIKTPEDAIRISKLQQEMQQFYNIVVNTCDVLPSCAPPSSNEDLRKIYSSSTLHLNEAKELLLNLLTTKFTPGNYANKLRKYLALRHLYSTVLEVLNLHFGIVEAQKNPENKKG